MMAGLDLAARYVEEGRAVALKSGRPTTRSRRRCVAPQTRSFPRTRTWREHGCAVSSTRERTLHRCRQMAASGIPIERVVKLCDAGPRSCPPHRAARGYSALAREGAVPMESDYMDENSRPGAVIGPKSVPRFTQYSRKDSSPKRMPGASMSRRHPAPTALILPFLEATAHLLMIHQEIACT